MGLHVHGQQLCRRSTEYGAPSSPIRFHLLAATQNPAPSPPKFQPWLPVPEHKNLIHPLLCRHQQQITDHCRCCRHSAIFFSLNSGQSWLLPKIQNPSSKFQAAAAANIAAGCNEAAAAAAAMAAAPWSPLPSSSIAGQPCSYHFFLDTDGYPLLSATHCCPGCQDTSSSPDSTMAAVDARQTNCCQPIPPSAAMKNKKIKKKKRQRRLPFFLLFLHRPLPLKPSCRFMQHATAIIFTGQPWQPWLPLFRIRAAMLLP